MKIVTAGYPRSGWIALGLLCAGIVGAQPSRNPSYSKRIAWVKDLATAQRQARSQKKLVLQFLMLGDLPDPHC
jgi:hypothetical protein